MSTETQYPHLTIDDGTVRIARTRYKVLHLAAEHYHHGWTAEELARQHLDLRPEEIYAALTYFYDHQAQLIAQMNSEVELAESMRSPNVLSREELLHRMELKSNQDGH